MNQNFMHTGRISRRALPVLHRSPSWPPMKFDFHEELKKVQKPRTIRKAVLFACFVIVNNIFIVVAATFLLRGYLQVRRSARLLEMLSRE